MVDVHSSMSTSNELFVVNVMCRRIFDQWHPSTRCPYRRMNFRCPILAVAYMQDQFVDLKRCLSV